MCLFPGERGLGSVPLTALFPHEDPSSSPRKPQLRTQVSGRWGTVRSGPPGTRESPVLSRVETSLSRVVPFLAAELLAAECLLRGPGPPALFSTSLGFGSTAAVLASGPQHSPSPCRGTRQPSIFCGPYPMPRCERACLGSERTPHGPCHPSREALSGQFPEWWDTGSSPPL